MKTIKTTIAFARFVRHNFREEAEYQTKVAADRKKQEAYDRMIAESQDKIGPYVPTPCPVQIWA